MEFPYNPASEVSKSVDKRFTDILNALKPQPSYNPNDIPSMDYDPDMLSNVSNMTETGLAMARSALNSQNINNQFNRTDDKNKNDANNAKAGMDTGDTSEDNLLAMIFKIVPIGINIAKKGATIAAGFKEIPTGIAELIANTVLMTVIVGIDSFKFVCQFAYYLFKLMICGVQKLTDIPKCIIFYILDIFILVYITIAISILFIVDMIFMVKKWLGISLVQLFIMCLGMIPKIDDMIYDITKIHMFRYPPAILKMCYVCSSMGDTREFKQTASKLFTDIFVQLPSSIGDPISEIITGFSHLFSFFDI